MDKKKLKSAMKGDKFSDLTVLLGVGRVAISRRLNGRVSFTLPEIQKIAEKYGFNESQINEIFFAN